MKYVELKGTEVEAQKELDTFISKGITVVDIWAPWCGPCRMIAPIIEELAEDNKVMKLNSDENSEIANKLGVRSIPTVLFFKDGKEIHRELGAKTLQHYQDLIKGM